MPKKFPVLSILSMSLLLSAVQPVQAFTVTYNAAADVPLTADTIAPGTPVDFALNFAPVTGTSLMVMNNTGLGFINGTFSNLAQGQLVALTYGGVSYKFVANYFGGTGNDLVLQWANSKLMAWGFNDVGQLGHNTSPADYSVTPVTVDAVDPPLTGVSALSDKRILAMSAGLSHSLAVCSDGTLAAWGLNDAGQLGDGTVVNRSAPVAVVKTGDLASKTFIAVAAGSYHSLALCSDGTVVAWGENHDGQLGTGDTDSSLVPVKVVTTGALAGRTVVAIAAGLSHSLALCSDGTIAAWGLNIYGQLGDGTDSPPDHSSTVPVQVVGTGVLSGKIVVAVAAGSFHSLALCSDGTLAAWGSHLYGQLGDGSPSSFGAHSDVPVMVSNTGPPSGKTIVAVSAGYYHSVALCSDGTLSAWGDNLSGQLGNNSSTPSTVPVEVIQTGVLLGKTVISVSCGAYHTATLCSDGTVVTWGDNDTGQLGNNSLVDSPVPVAVNLDSLAAGERFVGVAGGQTSNHSLGVVASPPPPPVVTTFAATSVGSSGAILNGTVVANDSSTAVSFDYGTGVFYGASVAASPTPVTGSSVTAVSAVVSGLAPATTYHFRIHGVGGAGAADGSDLTLTTLSNDAGLSSLSLSSGTLVPGFSTGTMSYTARVSNAVNSVSLTPTVSESHATVKVNGTPVASGAPSGSISLVVGDTPINAEVTAQDGVSQQTYSVVLTRETAIQSWRQTHFGTPSNSGSARDDADPNGNGLSNLLEYALDGDPTGNTTGIGILPAASMSGTNCLQLSFTRRLDYNDIKLTVQASDALSGPWTDLAESVNGAAFSGATTVETGSGITRFVTVGDLYLVTDPVHPTRFMRLQVTNSNP